MVCNVVRIIPSKMIPSETRDLFEQQRQASDELGVCGFSLVIHLKSVRNSNGDVLSTDAMSIMPLLGPDEIGGHYYTAKMDLKNFRIVLEFPVEWADVVFEICGYHF